MTTPIRESGVEGAGRGLDQRLEKRERAGSGRKEIHTGSSVGKRQKEPTRDGGRKSGGKEGLKTQLFPDEKKVWLVVPVPPRLAWLTVSLF